MKKSKFEFSNPHLVEMLYCENNDFTYDPSQGALDVPISISSDEKRDDSSYAAEVSLQIVIGEQASSLPFYIKMVMAANFKWEPNLFSSQQLSSLLSQNAPALLLSYARPIVSNITNVSRYPVYNLPYIDFTKPDNN